MCSLIWDRSSLDLGQELTCDLPPRRLPGHGVLHAPGWGHESWAGQTCKSGHCVSSVKLRHAQQLLPWLCAPQQDSLPSAAHKACRTRHSFEACAAAIA